MIPNRVPVLFAGRIEPGVKSRRHPFHFRHAHVVRQKGVQRQPDFPFLNAKFRLQNLHMRDHSMRVHAGVRAA